jgi:phospholipase/carboxylesterase
MEISADATLAAFDGLRAAAGDADELRGAFRALRKAPRALDPLYALARSLPPVSRFFLEPADRGDAAIAARLAQPAVAEHVGVIHANGAPGARGGFSIYAPEYYTPDRAWPLVMALHGGAGDGASFLWSWLPAARARGAIVVAPTAVGQTWALMGEDVDTPNLLRILDSVRARWNVDPTHMLLTGMSDGGTFCYVSGLEPQSSFTHLAPVSAAFHALLADMGDPARLSGLPIRITHGARDWMFAIDIAREARRALTAAGARVDYHEIADLSHCYPREQSASILEWMTDA